MPRMDDQREPRQIGVNEPSPAGLYDVLLGGQDHYSDEVSAIRRFSERWPKVASDGPANREFMRRAVRFLAEQGISQYLDLGCAKPTEDGGNVHEIAQAIVPGARVVSVDNDPTVRPHALAQVDGNSGLAWIEADVRDTEKILSHPETRELLDFSEPVGLLLVTTLHYLPDDDPAGVAARYLRDAAPGSYVVISHACSDGVDPDLVEAVRVAAGVHARPEAAILALFQGLELLEPGRLVNVRDWRAAGGEPSELPLLCGVARVG